MPTPKSGRRPIPIRAPSPAPTSRRHQERLVWGSDWPHPGVRDPEPKPDDAILIDLMLDWAPDEAVRNHILVDNAAKLYDFPKS